MEKVCVKASKIGGKGIFAKNAIRKGEVIGSFRGKVYAEKEFDKSDLPDGRFIRVDWDKFLLVDPPERYTNHSCRPNVGVRADLKLVALRSIRKGEELTVDYDTIEYDWDMKCNCRSDRCRKITKGFKHLSPYLKRKYRGFVAGYLLTKPPD